MLVLDKKTGELVQISVIKSVKAGTYIDERGFERQNWAATTSQVKSLSELLDRYEDIVPNSIENVHRGDKTTVVVECASESATKDILERFLAFKRLQDKGFRFVGRSIKDLTITYSFDNYDKSDIAQMNKDLDLLFSGENN